MWHDSTEHVSVLLGWGQLERLQKNLAGLPAIADNDNTSLTVPEQCADVLLQTLVCLCDMSIRILDPAMLRP